LVNGHEHVSWHRVHTPTAARWKLQRYLNEEWIDPGGKIIHVYVRLRRGRLENNAGYAPTGQEIFRPPP